MAQPVVGRADEELLHALGRIARSRDQSPEHFGSRLHVMRSDLGVEVLLVGEILVNRPRRIARYRSDPPQRDCSRSFFGEQPSTRRDKRLSNLGLVLRGACTAEDRILGMTKRHGAERPNDEA